MRQLIIARKDLDMSAGKLAAQCCHASLAFLSRQIKDSSHAKDNDKHYLCNIAVDKEAYENWFNGIFTKTICAAKNKNHLMKAIEIANSLGLQEDKDYFIVKDVCLTELEPEEYDENGIGRVITCVGFKPLPDEVSHAISKKFQLYK